MIDGNNCIGCVACMKVCPTKAIRIKNRKANILYSQCIDCGECLRVCPYNAVVPITTTRADLKKYKYLVALPSPVLYSQFGLNVMPHEILPLLKEFGFNYVYDLTTMCETTSLVIEEYLTEYKSPRPMISSACPVVVRLIQRLFPSLCELIIPVEAPREVAANDLRKEISKKENIRQEDIGIIHITPCAAKMVSINYPASMKKSFLDGAISIHEIFNTMMKKLKESPPPHILQIYNQISGIGLGWAIPGGEVRSEKHHSIAVSGIKKTIEILKDVEAGKLRNIEYLECNICPDSCLGGPLTVENRFIAKSNIQMLIRMYGGKRTVNDLTVKRLYKSGLFAFESKVKPNPFPPLDKDRARAIEKLKLKEETIKKLPGIDCGVCGAPDCKTLADDIARGKAKLTNCIFIREKSK
jgi:iron only hydrogenase large subunit-like protein